MVSWLLKLLFTAPLVYIIVVCVITIVGIWRAPPPDARLTLRALLQPIPKALVAPITFVQSLQAKGTLKVTLKGTGAQRIVDPVGPTVVSGQEVASTSQYLLGVTNENTFILHDVKMEVQLPFPIAAHSVVSRNHVRGLEIISGAGPMSVTILDSGQVAFSRTPRTPRIEVAIERMEPGAALTLALTLDTSRDIWVNPPPMLAGINAERLFVLATFQREVGASRVESRLFHSISVSSDRGLLLGPGTSEVPRLMKETAVDF